MDGDECSVVPERGNRPRKRKSYGRLADAAKKMRAQTHEVGEDCKCLILKCFANIPESERKKLLSDFNSLMNRDSQNLYLSGLVECNLVRQRSKRSEKDDSNLHSYSYKYKVRINRDGTLIEQQVCFKAFKSLHGVSGRRIQTIQEQLTGHGKVLPDQRGKHKNRPHALSEGTVEKVHEFFKSLRGRKSHYSLQKSDKIYLPDDLNIKKLLDMYKEKNPQNALSYHSFLNIFQKEYNFAFGYPRSDTCSTCDEAKAKKNMLNVELNKASSPETVQSLQKQIKTIETELELHQRKGQTFYDRKRACRQMCSTKVDHAAIAMDYQKNLSVPNISTNLVYYKRQLTVNLFNIHNLTTGEAYFFCYDQTIARKGSNEVASLLHHYIFNILAPDVKHLHIFCDSCGGQNKNKTLLRYIHYVVHQAKRLTSITMTFPERGHSYMECDRDMTLIPKKRAAELPQDWYQAIREARVKPCPFTVIECDQTMIKDWVNFFDNSGYYKKTLTVPTRPIKEIRIEEAHPRTLSFRQNYNGMWESSIITAKKSTTTRMPEGEFLYPMEAYDGPHPIPTPKWNDLQVRS